MLLIDTIEKPKNLRCDCVMISGRRVNLRFEPIDVKSHHQPGE
jgi:hypothetical protein